MSLLLKLASSTVVIGDQLGRKTATTKTLRRGNYHASFCQCSLPSAMEEQVTQCCLRRNQYINLLVYQISNCPHLPIKLQRLNNQTAISATLTIFRWHNAGVVSQRVTCSRYSVSEKTDQLPYCVCVQKQQQVLHSTASRKVNILGLSAAKK